MYLSQFSSSMSPLSILYVILITFIQCGAPQEADSFNNRESSLLTGNTNRLENPNDNNNNEYTQKLLNSNNSSSNSNGIGSSKIADGFLPLPAGYNKLSIPKTNGSAIYVMMYLSIRSILDVDQEKGILELDGELGMQWLDWEIWEYFIENKEIQAKAATGPDEIILDSDFLKSIWKPDVFFEELASVDTTYLLSKQIRLAFLVRKVPIVGVISATSRQTLKVRCDMDFHYYPADTQHCELNLRSFAYPENELFLLWAPNQSVYLDQIDDPNFNFQVSDVEPGNDLYDLFTTYQAPCCTAKNFSTLTFTIQLRRNLTYHFVQTCLPSIILILITWLCFLLPGEMVEARIGISMTTLLTIIALFATVREQAPSVSYTMAIDIWMVFCVFLIFMALVLFTMMYWLRWKYTKNSKENEKDIESDENQARDGEEQETSEGTSNGHGGRGVPAKPANASATPSPTNKNIYIKYHQQSRRYAFKIFALLFIGFLVGFSIWLINSSKYFEWDPSPKYNSLEENDISTRLFKKLEARFWANTTQKAVDADFRYEDLKSQVICPKLKLLNPDDPCDAESEEEEK